MSKFLKRSAQGAQVPHEKRTSNLETVKMPLPSKIVLSMGQHIGAPAAPAVAKGDQVCVGTVVGKAGGFVSMDIHSGVSGTVAGIITLTAPNRGLPALLDIPVVKNGTQERTVPMGAGPYRFVSDGDGARLEADPDWWQGKTLPVEAIPLVQACTNGILCLFIFLVWIRFIRVSNRSACRSPGYIRCSAFRTDRCAQ